MITKQITQVGGSGYTAPEDAAIYLIHMDGQAAIVDAGCGGAIDRLIENIRACEGHFSIYHGKANVRKFIRSFMTVS